MKLKKTKELLVMLAIAGLAGIQSSCYNSERSPGWEYMPDMANAVTYETYSENLFYADSMSSRIPVTGTIPRGAYQRFHFSPNATGYDSAGMILKFPAWLATKDSVEGKHQYDIYCAVCHGMGGRANGTIVENTNIKNPFPPPPSYFREDIMALPEGKMYYSVHYGKNMMGPYSKFLNHDQIWQVVYYVRSLQKTYSDSLATAAAKAPAVASADTTKK